jgi:hypothetical protein
MSANVKVISDVLNVGDVMPERHEHAGWIYGGVSKTTGKPFYIAPNDTGVMEWQDAMDLAARSNASLPSREELNQIYEARNEGALKGKFDSTGAIPAGWYWSSSQYCGYGAWAQRFSEGGQYDGYETIASMMRASASCAASAATCSGLPMPSSEKGLCAEVGMPVSPNGSST